MFNAVKARLTKTYFLMLYALYKALCLATGKEAQPMAFFNFKLDTIIEAIAAIVTVTMVDVYVIGNEAIINTSTTIGAVVAPILQAVLLVVGILIAIGLLRGSGKGNK